MPTITCRFLPANAFNREASVEKVDVQAGDMFFQIPMGLCVVLPTGDVWRVDMQTNCGLRRPHRCWRWSGDPPNITVVQGECPTGAGSVSFDRPDGSRYHAFLWHGKLIDIEQAKIDQAYFLTLSVEDRIKLKARTYLDAVPWHVAMKPEDVKQFADSDRKSRVHFKDERVLEGIVETVEGHYQIVPVSEESGVVHTFGPLVEFSADEVDRID